MSRTVSKASGRLGPHRKLTLTQVARLLRRLEGGESRAGVARAFHISPQSVDWWRPYMGLNTEWLTRVRTLENANWNLAQQLKYKSDGLKAATAIIKRLEPRPGRRGLYAAAIQAGHDLSRRQANMVCGINEGVGQKGERSQSDERLVATMRAFMEENPGRGFRGMFDALRYYHGISRAEALVTYQRARLQIKWRKKPAEMPVRVVKRLLPAGHRDQTWAMDFLVEALPSGKRYYVLSIVDIYSRECVACRVLPRETAVGTVAVLEDLVSQHRCPQVIQTDNGVQFKSQVYEDWAKRNKVRRHYSRVHTPSDNAYVERFHRTMRKEVLDWYRFRSLVEVQRMLDDWRVRYNMARPHMSLYGLSPLQFVELYSGK